MLGRLYAGVGKMMPGAKTGAMAAARTAMKPMARRGARMSSAGYGSIARHATTPAATRTAGRDAMQQYLISQGKTPTRIGIAAGLVGTSTAMRPNANQSRTSYRGPMQTGRGSGRYA